MRDAPPRTQGYFLLLVQEKVARRKDSPDGANPPAHPRLWGPRPTHATSCRGVWSRTSMSATPAGRFPKALRCLGAPYGDPQTTPAQSCPHPHPSPAGGRGWTTLTPRGGGRGGGRGPRPPRVLSGR